MSLIVSVLEFDPTQPVAESLLHQGTPITGGARQGVILEAGPQLRGQAHGASLQTEASTWRAVF